MKIWIARNDAHTDDAEFDLTHFLERHPEKEREFGTLHMFYDKPTYNKISGGYYGWTTGRIACEIPSYMFPNINCGECLEFTAPEHILEHSRFNGVIINEELIRGTQSSKVDYTDEEIEDKIDDAMDQAMRDIAWNVHVMISEGKNIAEIDHYVCGINDF